MQEDKQNAQRTDILHQEEIHMEIAVDTQGTVIRKLIAHKFMRHKPSD